MIGLAGSDWNPKASMLTPDAKAAIHEEVASLTNDYKNLLREAKLYRAIVWATFAFFFGGSIYGYGKIKDYIDEQILSKASRFDQIYLANSLASQGQQAQSLYEISDFIEKTRKNKSNTNLNALDDLFEEIRSSSQRDFIILTILEALAFVSDKTPDGDYIGRREWEAVIGSSYFQRELYMGSKFRNSYRANVRIGLSWMHFSKSTGDVRKSLEFLNSALALATSPSDRGPAHMSIAYVQTILGEHEAARNSVKFANREKPGHVTIDNVLNWSDFQWYLQAWNATRPKDIGAEEALVRNVTQALNEEDQEYVRHQISNIARIDSQFSEEWLRQYAIRSLNLYSEQISSGKTDLIELSPILYAFSKFSIEAYKERRERRFWSIATYRSVVVSEVNSKGNSYEITVKLELVRASWAVDNKNNIIEGSRVPREEVQFLTLQRDYGTANSRWIMANIRQ